MEQHDRGKAFPHKTWFRILAAVLAAALLGTAVLAGLSGIRFDKDDYRESKLQEIAEYLSDSTEYMDASLGQRMMDTLSELVGTPKTYDDYYLYAQVAIARKDYPKAAQYLQGCIQRTGSAPIRSELYVKQGCLYALMEDWAQALGEFTSSILLGGDDPAAYLMRAQCYAQLGNAQATLADLETYRGIAGEQPSLLSAMGQLYQATGGYEQAAECYTKLLGSEASQYYDVSLYADRAQCYAMLGMNTEALADCRSYMERGGTDEKGQIQAVRGVCAMSEGEYREAVEMFEGAVAQGYAYPATLYAQSVLCCYILGEYDAVIANGQKALQLAEADASVILFSGDTAADRASIVQWMGLAELAKGDYEAALVEFDQCAALSPDMEDLHYYRGVCLSELERYEEAAQEYTQSIAREESVSLCYYNRAVTFLQTEDYYAAAADLLQVMERNEDEELVKEATELLSTFAQIQTEEPAGE